MCGTNYIEGLNRSQRDTIRDAGAAILPLGQGGPASLALRFVNKAIDENPLPVEQVLPSRQTTSGGPTRLGIGRRTPGRSRSNRRSRVSGRSRSKRKAFST